MKKKENFFKTIGIGIKKEAEAFVHDDLITRLSYIVMGAGNFLRGQIVRGIIYLAVEVGFFWYIFTKGSYWMSMLPSLGINEPSVQYNEFYDQYVPVYGDNSFQILLYGILSILIIIAFVFVWHHSILESRENAELKKNGKKPTSFAEDVKSLLDEKFYKTLLVLPVTGIVVFTAMPILFMIFVAFTNYDGTHDGYFTNLFHWVGWQNFKTLLSFSEGGGTYAKTFASVLGWTVIWAFFATFSCYILGILVAMMINRKSIKLKKMWRTIFVMTIAIPQFISLMYVSKMFSKSGLVNGFLISHNIISKTIPFFEDPILSKVMVILINIWIGIPYLMIIATGILMNIPDDLYEAARIDGANPFQQFRYITMPYMLFITAPYLLTSFTGNMNNFNVIFLLTSGGPANTKAAGTLGGVGHTDLLITWLFKITTGAESAYYLASVIGIVLFIIVSIITLTVYKVLPSIKNEEGMS